MKKMALLSFLITYNIYTHPMEQSHEEEKIEVMRKAIDESRDLVQTISETLDRCKQTITVDDRPRFQEIFSQCKQIVETLHIKLNAIKNLESGLSD